MLAMKNIKKKQKKKQATHTFAKVAGDKKWEDEK